MAINNNAALYDLDCTYSPKVFQNEGTNSRYSSEDENDEPIQNSTQIEVPPAQLNQEEDQDDLLLENFIKEMLPPVANSPPQSPAPTRSRMASSMSSEAPFLNLTAKSRIRNSGSTSSLNSVPRPRTISATSYSKVEKPLKPIKPIQKVIKKPITQKPVTKPANLIKKQEQQQPKKASTFIKAQPKASSSTSAPVVAMTRTAQLRAKLATSNNINNTQASAKPSTTTTTRKPIHSTKPRLKENIKDTPVNSVHINPHLDHLSRGGPRRNSFSFSSGNKLDKSKRDADTSISSTSSLTKTVNGSTKPRSTWK